MEYSEKPLESLRSTETQPLYNREFEQGRRQRDKDNAIIIIIIIIIIIDIYPGSSTHSKVVFKEVLHPIELEFGNVDFCIDSYVHLNSLP